MPSIVQITELCQPLDLIPGFWRIIIPQLKIILPKPFPVSLQIITFYCLQPFFPAIFTTDWKQSYFLFSSLVLGWHQKISHHLCSAATAAVGLQEAQWQRDSRSSKGKYSRSACSLPLRGWEEIVLSAFNSPLPISGFRDWSTTFGQMIIVVYIYFEQGQKKTPLLLQNDFLQKGRLYSWKLFTSKGWKSFLFGSAVHYLQQLPALAVLDPLLFLCPSRSCLLFPALWDPPLPFTSSAARLTSK